jgi:hypothetical protein
MNRKTPASVEMFVERPGDDGDIVVGKCDGWHGPSLK